MKGYQSILVGIDFSDASRSALIAAIRIATFDHAKITATHILDPCVADAISKANGFSDDQLKKAVEDSLYRFLAESEVAAGTVQINAGIGHPVVSLMQACRDNASDLLILGTQGVRRKHHRVGAVAGKCVRKAPADVLLVRPGSPGPFRRALVCIDFSETSAKALHSAIHLHRCDGMELECVHVCKTPLAMTSDYGPYLPGLPFWDGDEILRCKQDLDSFVAARMPTGMAKVWRNSVHESFSIREALSRHVQDTSCDLVVLGTKGAGNIAVMIAGTTAESMITHADTAILAVKGDLCT